MIRSYLEQSGFQVIVAHDGECVMKLGANTASATKRMITANNRPVRDRSELSRETPVFDELVVACIAAYFLHGARHEHLQVDLVVTHFTGDVALVHDQNAVGQIQHFLQL